MNADINGDVLKCCEMNADINGDVLKCCEINADINGDVLIVTSIGNYCINTKEVSGRHHDADIGTLSSSFRTILE